MAKTIKPSRVVSRDDKEPRLEESVETVFQKQLAKIKAQTSASGGNLRQVLTALRQ